jgi:transcription antitermination factor NusG
MDWYVAAVKSGAEKEAIGELAGEGLVTFMPVCRIERHDRRKRMPVIRKFPVIRGYVFIGFDGVIDFYSVHQAGHVTGILGCNGVPQRVRETDVQALMRGQKDGAFDRDANGMLVAEIRKNKGLQPNDRVKVETGPFTGFFATVTHPAGKRLVKTMMDIFGALTPCEFALDQIKKVA